MRAACLNKTKKSPNFLNSWIEIQRVREREREKTQNPKAESLKRSPPDHPSPHPLRLLTAATAAAAASRSRHAHAPFACPDMLSDLVCFCFVFFFFSFPVFLFRFCSSATSLLLTYLSLAIVVCWLIILSTFFYYRIVGWLFIQQTTPKIYTHIILKMGPKITISL